MDYTITLAMLPESFDVHALRVVKSTIPLAYADDLITCLVHQPSCVRPHVPEALHYHSRVLRRHTQLLQSLVGHDHHAATRGFTPSARSTDVDRLPRNNGCYRLAHVHGIGIHHPRHYLLVRIHVRSRNIFLRSDELDELCRVPPSHTFEFVHRHLLRVADHATLRATERNVDDRALPGHPCRKCPDFVQVYIRRISDSALGGSASYRVLNAIAGEYFQVSIIHRNRDVNCDLSARLAEDLPKTFIEIKFVGSELKSRCLCFPRIGFLRNNGCHAISELCTAPPDRVRRAQHLRSAYRSVESWMECRTLSPAQTPASVSPNARGGRRQAKFVPHSWLNKLSSICTALRPKQGA